MKLTFRPFELHLAQPWTIARTLTPGGNPESSRTVIFVELKDEQGLIGRGETSPSKRYDETPETVLSFLAQVNPAELSFRDIDASMEYLQSLSPGAFAAKCALNIALLDGAAKLADKPVCESLGLNFAEGKHFTSYSIGLADPQAIREKVLAAEPYPILKLKVGGPHDRENLAALRDVAPDKIVRVDANEGWKTKEEALRQIEWLAGDPNIEFVEQPMPATTDGKDWVWLSERSPLPMMADESYRFETDLAQCAQWARLVNVKLVKTGGITGAVRALTAARDAWPQDHDRLHD